MISADLMQAVRLLEIKTRRACAGFQQGEFRKTRQGSGFEFDQLDEYHPGCDIRFIDWKGTARTQKILVRRFKDERQRKILLVVDISSSTYFGSNGFLKHSVNMQIAAILAFAGSFCHDAVGCFLFDEDIVDYLPARADQKHIIRLVKHLLSKTTRGKGTRFDAVLAPLLQMHETPLLVIVISDFISMNAHSLWTALTHKHEVCAIRVGDMREKELPQIMPFVLEDPETGELLVCQSKQDIRHINNVLQEREDEQKMFFKKNNIAYLHLLNHENFINDVVKFFKAQIGRV
ncbi:MAG: DUF58 domain-containing protein [Candidatus Babeliaceae bacterium]